LQNVGVTDSFESTLTAQPTILGGSETESPRGSWRLLNAISFFASSSFLWRPSRATLQRLLAHFPKAKDLIVKLFIGGQLELLKLVTFSLEFWASYYRRKNCGFGANVRLSGLWLPRHTMTF
jgi:hypothetical protein